MKRTYTIIFYKYLKLKEKHSLMIEFNSDYIRMVRLFP